MVSSDSGAFNGLLSTLADGRWARETIYHHNSSHPNASLYAGPIHGREASVFLMHAAQRYNSLADQTVFVHEDVWTHNPVWPHWVACLRKNVTQASLSPLWREVAPGPPGALGTLLGANQQPQEQRVPWSCCFLVVQARDTVLRIPQATYSAAQALLASGKDHSGASVTAFHLENSLHLLQKLPTNWLKPCKSYRCEDARCRRVVQFVYAPAGPLSHGLPMSVDAPSMRAWQEHACGVRKVDEPETRELASVRQVVTLPCGGSALGITARTTGGSMMQTVGLISNRSGCPSSHGRRRPAWMNEATARYAQSLRQLERTVPSAKIAVFALKAGICSALVRCWQACCAECARRAGWCRAWSWTLSDATCALSDTEPTVSGLPTFDRVVGLGA